MTRAAEKDALDQVLDALADRIADRVADRISAQLPDRTAAVDYYDQRTSPLGRRRFLEEARRGSFASTRRGKQVLALRSEVDGWLAASMRRRQPANDQAEPREAADDCDALLKKAGVIPRGPARCGPSGRSG